MASALILGVPAAAAAATVTFTNITGGFFNGVLANPATSPAISYTGVDTNNTGAAWGTPAGFGQSGYKFATAGSISAAVTPPAGVSPTVTLGTFQHVNFPISSGTSITSISLRFNADVDVDGVSQGNRSFLYQFSHDETPNAADPCADGGAQGVGVNINGCADRVSVNFISQSDSFDIGGVAYTLDVVGFVSGGGSPVTNFLTVERLTNEAFIVGRLTQYDIAAGVPEPATWALLIGGFGMVGAAARRRRALVA
ncbi:PEP-CTERM sorting domain-containing protein [Glacieibacterium frigidum]|uniref:PEP-CTERM sorting domain-containing protein n=2 Tax=Glacieibacterium frigidum TaxID=2593303 RepID=A0A552UJK8_9SPHN|nr:PEP-CTERM sorting domain-containing protein [Glacieibacterium frigidum]